MTTIPDLLEMVDSTVTVVVVLETKTLAAIEVVLPVLLVMATAAVVIALVNVAVNVMVNAEAIVTAVVIIEEAPAVLLDLIRINILRKVYASPVVVMDTSLRNVLKLDMVAVEITEIPEAEEVLLVDSREEDPTEKEVEVMIEVRAEAEEKKAEARVLMISMLIRIEREDLESTQEEAVLPAVLTSLANLRKERKERDLPPPHLNPLEPIQTLAVPTLQATKTNLTVTDIRT